MTIEQTKEAIKVMQAYCDGKQIQYKERGYNNWKDYEFAASPLWTWSNSDYRIKPEKKVRPYTFEEMCEAVKKHGVMVKSERNAEVTTILNFDKENVFYFNEFMESYSDFAKNNIWLDDDSPCGIIEE